MKIWRNGQAFELTPQELEEAFREKDHQYLVEDAHCYLLAYFDTSTTMEQMETLNKKDNKTFQKMFGFSFEEAVDKNSPNYLLDKLVEIFSDTQDSCVTDETTWNRAVLELVEEEKEENREK